MVNWQVTAKTIYCDAVDDEITIIIQKDWSVRCTGYIKYNESVAGSSNLKRKAKKIKRQLKCEGPECPRIIQYKERLLEEETSKLKQGQTKTG